MLMKNKRLPLFAMCCLAMGLNLTAQTVTTNPYIARGATTAFVRTTITGFKLSDMKERGVCWSSENSQPTIADAHTTRTVSQGATSPGGVMHRINDLKPTTVYHVRGYVLQQDSTVHYGEAVKVITIPKGTIGWTYNNGEGTAEIENRIKTAVINAVNYLNEYTSISGFHTTVNYNPGVPTAECSYGGWMSVGAQVGNQKTGTILHELLHGIGVGTHWVWKDNAALRANTTRGTWLGDRVTELLRFWENDASSVLNGDDTHMWPYGINGAHEDTGSEMLYIGCALIAQALGEDGLPPTGGFCTPAYAFNQEDTIKYYIKNEDPSGGLHTSYLRESRFKQILGSKMTADEAIGNDSCAWYITFNPKTRYYQLRNAATGKFLTYNGTGLNGFKLTDQGFASTNENFHLMRSRIDADFGGTTLNGIRGYWIIHPESTMSPNCLSAGINGLTTTAKYDMGNDATKQRWIIMTADELRQVEESSKQASLKELDDAIGQLKTLMETPHTEDVAGVDMAMEAFIAAIEGKETSTITISEIGELTAEVNDSCTSFLSQTKPADARKPFDLTYMIEDAGIATGSGWSIAPTINYSCGEFYQKAFDMNQTIAGLPAGTYELRAQGFQRPGSSADSYSAYIAGNNKVVATLYIGSKSTKLQHIAAEARSNKVDIGAETAVGSPAQYIPNDMQATSAYFLRGLYENSVMMELANKGSLKIGIKNTSSATNYWTIFDNFRLYYYGSLSPEEIAGIDQPVINPNAPEALFATPADIYDITGICVRKQATGLEGLPKGFYIVKGKKVIVR